MSQVTKVVLCFVLLCSLNMLILIVYPEWLSPIQTTQLKGITISSNYSKKNIWSYLTVPITPPNCSLLFSGDQDEISRVNKLKNKHWTIPPDVEFYKAANSCKSIRDDLTRNYYVSAVEKNFSLAFALNVHNSPQQIFRLLQVIYRPHNVYCIHYDYKSNNSFKHFIKTIADCLPNVIIPSKIENVIRSWHTVVDAQMNCMSDLYKLRDRYPWRYVMTLCGKEVPLKTNREMVEILMKRNGTSAVLAFGNTKMEIDYFWKYKYILNENGGINRTSQTLSPPPFNLTMMKSLAYYGLTDAFVHFLLHNEKVQVFRKFIDDTLIPEERFIGTIFSSMKGVPGGKNAQNKVDVVSVIWMSDGRTSGCSGDTVHFICVIHCGDLHRIQYRYTPEQVYQALFHNKYFIERDRVVIDCVEKELIRRNKREYYLDHHKQ